MGQSLRGKGDGEGLKKSERVTGMGQHLGCKYIIKNITLMGASLGPTVDAGWGRLPGVSMRAILVETPRSGTMEPEVVTSCSQTGLPVEG